MRELPSGTVTFLFTDVEGSTKLLHELGEQAYADALAEHRRVVRDAFAEQGGVEVDTQGDAFFVAFPTAPGALAAAAQIRERLASGRIRVRVGVHTGTPLLTDEGYVGHDVHRAARIASAGHGGQILVSASTAALSSADGLRDLGQHRLKDLSAAERIYQVGEGDFPPLKSLHQTNLPIPATPFLGREEEVRDISALLTHARLVTLTGPGGSGKTRLGLQSAAAASDAFPAGVWWVPLAPLTDSALVIDAAARALGATGDVKDFIGDKLLLLFFDNFEHVIDAAPDVAELLHGCPNATVLVTSREPLHIEGEVDYAVDPLRDAEAITLFETRARAAKRDFMPSVEVCAICARLDNLPLAIELAAARVKFMSPAALLERLDQRLPVLTSNSRDAPERQRTLRSTIEWSHDLLDEDEKVLFRRLGVFAGGSTLETTEDVCAANLQTLASLVDKSLVRVRDADRYWMLETIRDFAREQLDASGEAAELRRWHADHFAELALRAEPNLRGNPKEWLDRLEADHDNVRTALDWLDEAGETQRLLAAVGALARFWTMHGHFAEAARRLERALARDTRPTTARARALEGAVVVGFSGLARADQLSPAKHAEEAFAINHELGDDWGIAHSLFLLGLAATDENDFARARTFFEQSAERFDALGDDHYTLLSVRQLAWSNFELGDTARARELHHDVVSRATELGNVRMKATSLGALSEYALYEGDLEASLPMLEEATRIYFDLGDVIEVATNLCRYAQALVLAGKAGEGAQVLSCAHAIYTDRGATMAHWVRTVNAETEREIRELLDDASFDAEWEAGAMLSPGDAFAFALRALDSSMRPGAKN